MPEYNRYHHSGIEQAAADLDGTSKKLRARLDQFVADVKKELPNWEGESAKSFQAFHDRWNKQIDELHLFASQLPGLVREINERAMSTDKRNADMFQ